MRLFALLTISTVVSAVDPVPSDQDVQINLADGDGSGGATIILDRQSTKPQVRVDILLAVKNPRAEFTLEMGSGRLMFVSKMPSKSANPPEEAFDPWFHGEVDSNAPKADIVRTALRHFTGGNRTVERFYLVGSDATWSAAILDSLAHEAIQLRAAEIGFGQESPLEESRLLHFIQQTRVKELELSDAKIVNISNAFYRSPTVASMDIIDIMFIEENAITDDILAFLRAERLTLGKASSITINGIRSFFDSLFDLRMKRRSLSLRPSFNNVDFKTLFRGLKAKELPALKMQTLRSRQWELTKENKKFEFQIMTSRRFGVYEFTGQLVET